MLIEPVQTKRYMEASAEASASHEAYLSNRMGVCKSLKQIQYPCCFDLVT